MTYFFPSIRKSDGKVKPVHRVYVRWRVYLLHEG